MSIVQLHQIKVRNYALFKIPLKQLEFVLHRVSTGNLFPNFLYFPCVFPVNLNFPWYIYKAVPKLTFEVAVVRPAEKSKSHADFQVAGGII